MNNGICLSLEFIQQLANYLGTKPFNEVAGFISHLQKESQLQGQPTVSQEKKE